MRDFSRTGEPSGEAEPRADGRGVTPAALTDHSAGHSFVIQQHAARRMHYDFRLELDGVLLSWSVPKGPSLSPAERRLAVRTEDHPLDYADFEGVIPKGQYGGGTVVVWDRGSWEPAGDARDGLAKGKLTFILHGHKLHGRWHLVRTRPTAKAESWLLFKGRDEAANDELDITTAEPASVLSGRTVEQIAEAPDRVWHSDRPTEPTVADRRAARVAAVAQARSKASEVRTAAPAHAASAEQTADSASADRTTGAARAATALETADVRSLVAQLPVGFPLTNLDKVLYPDMRLTKAELIAYFAVAAEHALPHIAHRPLMLMRCPDGVRNGPRGRGCFIQKHTLPGAPSPIETVSVVESDGKTADHMQIRDMPGLVALAQLGALEIHTWGCRADRLDQPDLLVFDLDPDTGLGWEKVALAAFELRRRLHDLELESFVKTTGGKGLHVVAPIAPDLGPDLGWDGIKAFSLAVVAAMEHDEPALYTTNMAKAQRKGKIYLDYLRNSRGATFIAPYSPRARAGAPVAVPISWDELAHGVDPAAFTTATVPHRLVTQRTDPWQTLPTLHQSIKLRPPSSPRGNRSHGGKR